MTLPVDEACKAAPLGVETRGVARVDGLEVGSGAKHRPGLTLGVCLDDPHPYVSVAFELVDGSFDPFSDITIDGVACFGSVESDDRNAAGGFVGDDV